MHYEDAFWPTTPHTLGGFDELHQFTKQGNEFCREVASIFSERADAEKEYSKTLQRIAKKARGATKLCIGSLNKAWQKFVDHLDMLSEAHRTLNTNLTAEAHKPMKLFVDGQVKQRKPVEQAVRDCHKSFLERRNEEMRAKKQSFAKSKECNLLWEQLENSKNGHRAMSEKEATKLDARFRKAEEALLKADRDYKELNKRSEAARLAWESAMHKCCTVLENLEIERLGYIRNALSKYSELSMTAVPVVQTSCDSIVTDAEAITPDEDIRVACETCGTGPNQPEQLLYDCYEQDMSNSIDKERRKVNLSRKIREYTEDLQRQVKTKEGIDNLKRVYDSTPDFCDEKALEDVTRQLYESDATMNLLKANRYQLMCAHNELTGRSPPIEAYNEYITTSKDKGMNMSIMRIPLELFASLASCDIDYEDNDHVNDIRNRSLPRPPGLPRSNDEHYQVPNISYGYLVPITSHQYHYIESSQQDGSVSPSGDDLNEFSDHEGDNEISYQFVAKCQVLYDYDPQQSDELKIVEGDVINVIDKQEDDWWQGELNGIVGIFPATYVQDITGN